MSEQSGEAVWDGRAWVHPATGQVWDGTRWGPAAPMAPPPAAAPVTGGAGGGAVAPSGVAVGRGGVFGQVLWRVVLLCVGGGATVGFLLVAVLLAFPDDNGDEAWSFLLVGPMAGAIVGVMLAIVAGPVIAGVCAATLVPYPGAAKARLVARVLGVGLVALFIPLLFSGGVSDVGAMVLIGGIWAASVAGAWFGSPWVVRWYVRRAEVAVDPARVAPPSPF